MVETVKYEVLRKLNQVEIRRYPKIVLAKVGNYENDSFGLLFRFISGDNKAKEKVKMTAPIVSQDAFISTSKLFDNEENQQSKKR